MNEKSHALVDLEALVGIPKRTIRSYIEKGLLPEPIGAGRAAYYDENHLLRLCAIRVLRDFEDRSLSEIRRLLAGRPANELLDYARRLIDNEPILARPLCRTLPDLGTRPSKSETALDYVRRIRRSNRKLPMLPRPSASVVPPQSSVGDVSRDSSEERPEALASLRGRFEELFGRRANQTGPSQMTAREPSRQLMLSRAARLPMARNVRRRAKAEPILRIAVTPDVDLIVRGVYEKDEIDRIERAADQLRRALTSGRDDD